MHSENIAERSLVNLKVFTGCNYYTVTYWYPRVSFLGLRNLNYQSYKLGSIEINDRHLFEKIELVALKNFKLSITILKKAFETFKNLIRKHIINIGSINYSNWYNIQYNSCYYASFMKFKSQLYKSYKSLFFYFFKLTWRVQSFWNHHTKILSTYFRFKFQRILFQE